MLVSSRAMIVSRALTAFACSVACCICSRSRFSMRLPRSSRPHPSCSQVTMPIQAARLSITNDSAPSPSSYPYGSTCPGASPSCSRRRGRWRRVGRQGQWPGWRSGLDESWSVSSSRAAIPWLLFSVFLQAHHAFGLVRSVSSPRMMALQAQSSSRTPDADPTAE